MAICIRRDRTAEQKRLYESYFRRADWKNWGPYVSDRAWGTVREDYSQDGSAWSHFPHDHARSRAYRWNEDGLAGICNRYQNVCLAVALWNEKDPFLKERFFGVTGSEGNHGEDVKEYYFYLDSTPTHSYMKMLYKYPQAEYPYRQLVEESRKRDRNVPEFELVDTNIFHENRYFDVYVEYAKAEQEDILCVVTVINRGPEAAPIHVLPHIWFRNTWSWGYDVVKPFLKKKPGSKIFGNESHFGDFYLWAEGNPELYFTENETNNQRLFGVPNNSPYVKDGIHETVVNQLKDKVNFEVGTKAAVHYRAVVEPNSQFVIKYRFSKKDHVTPFEDFDRLFAQRKQEADEYWDNTHPKDLPEEEKMIQRQAFAGVMWTKQYYHYGVELWLKGDPKGPTPPKSRWTGRNAHWMHFYATDVITMPDKWEYPWFAAWDLAFHCIPIGMIDPEWAKRQLILMTREWYMHPSGQLAAYEWNFGDVNPPVHAWAAMRVYKLTRKLTGHEDFEFLERIFHKLLLNFTWWVNRKDTYGNNIFEGGFLGLDNIGVFDRSAPLPTGGYLQQADGTAWMAMFCLNMLDIAVELAVHKISYEDVATKFFEHFVSIAHSISHIGDTFGEAKQIGLWDDEDGFFYDTIVLPNGHYVRVKLKSLVGLTPLFAVHALRHEVFEKLPKFASRVQWFFRHRAHLVKNLEIIENNTGGKNYLLSLVSKSNLTRVLSRMLDPNQFLSEFGLRSMSKEHEANPYIFEEACVKYDPGDASSPLFGGNSNWRGPIWFPTNYLLIEALQKYGRFYADDLKVEMPTGSGQLKTLTEVADDISKRLIAIFKKNSHGVRPFHVNVEYFKDQYWVDNILFYEFFHGDTGAGHGASHQTGWTALVADLIDQCFSSWGLV